MKTDLLDVNIWVALAAPGHAHYRLAHQFWKQNPSVQLGLTRVTSMGFLRVSTNVKALRDDALTYAKAWEALERLESTPSIVQLTEPTNLNTTYRTLSTLPTFKHRDWTDAYLAAFAIAGGYRLVTFDAGFKQYPDLDLLLLA